jgi:hypothetical protein
MHIAISKGMQALPLLVDVKLSSLGNGLLALASNQAQEQITRILGEVQSLIRFFTSSLA